MEHRATLLHLRPVIGPPVLGRVDGTAAAVGDRGFVFLFNPNYRALDAQFALDVSLGLTKGEAFVLRELYPHAGRLLGKPHAGLWHRGDEVRLPIKGPEARVVEVVPAESLKRPALLNAGGKAVLSGDSLVLSDVEGEMGTSAELAVLLPPDHDVAQVSVNGRRFSSFENRNNLATLAVTFAGRQFEHCQQVGSYDRNSSSKLIRADFTVPQRIFAQLAERRKAWPIPYTENLPHF